MKKRVKDKDDEVAPLPLTAPRARHVKKRVLKNKALSVSFSEKDLKDYVGGFHKRKKKRRKVAQKEQGEALRRKRIELRKKRKLEREFVQFGGPAPTDTKPQEADEENDDEGIETTSASGTTMYDNGELQVTVTTSEIKHDDDDEDNFLHNKILSALPTSSIGDKKLILPAPKSTSAKKVARRGKSRKTLSKKDKQKAKNKNTMRR